MNSPGSYSDRGVRALIGKGGMGALVREQLKNRGVYLAFTGGCAALASSHMTLKGEFFPDPWDGRSDLGDRT